MGSFELINGNQSDRWDVLVKSFSGYDVYYLFGYVKGFFLHGDGVPLLIYYNNNDLRGINVVMKRDVSQTTPFNGLLPAGTYYDYASPYGYGGFIFEGNVCAENMTLFMEEYLRLLVNEKVVCEFIRFHPLLDNADRMRPMLEVIDLGKTISIDLASPDCIWSEISRERRNRIRKAQKLGIKIAHGRGMDLLERFKPIYEATMERDHAHPYYYFGNSFYHSIHNNLSDNYEIFYAVLGDKIVSMALIIFANQYMHYHLSGSLAEYLQMASFSLLLYEAACWGNEQGFKKFHLGGGLGSKEDCLYKFKQEYNRHSSNQFSVGRLIGNPDAYDFLVDTRRKKDALFAEDSSYFPLYRS